MWKLPWTTIEENIRKLTEATSPLDTFVTSLANSKELTLEKSLGTKRKKQLVQYERDFYNTFVKQKKELQQEDAPQINQAPGNNIMSNIHDNLYNSDYSFGNTTTLSSTLLSDTSMQQPPSTISTAMITDVGSTHDTVSLRPTSSHESMSSPNLSPIVSISKSSPNQLDNSSIMDLGTTHDDDLFTEMEECHADNRDAYYFPLLFLVNNDSDFTFADESYSTVPKAKAFHEYCSEDLHPVRCVSSFLYLVFRDPLAKESTCFKAGFRTFNEPKHTYDQATMENQRRYVTSFGMGTRHYRYATWFCMISFLFVSFF